MKKEQLKQSRNRTGAQLHNMLILARADYPDLKMDVPETEKTDKTESDIGLLGKYIMKAGAVTTAVGVATEIALQTDIPKLLTAGGLGAVAIGAIIKVID